MRDGKRKKISVRIGVHPEDRTLKSAGNRQRSKDSSPSKSYRGQKAPFELGFQIESYSENLAQQLSISSQLQKPIVVKVQKNSPADKADLQVGDLIVGVNQKNVRSAKDVIRRLINGPNALIVRRNGAQVFIFIEP